MVITDLLLLHLVVKTVYSLDGGATFKTGTQIPQLGGEDLQVKDFIYGQGVFMAIGDKSAIGTGAPQESQDEIDKCATTEDGLVWTERNMNNNARLYSRLVFINPGNVGTFIAFGDQATSNALSSITTGKRAKFKANVSKVHLIIY